MSLRILDFDLRVTDVPLRIPFKYGIATMTRMPYLFVRTFIEVNGRTAAGTSADCLPAKWFTKDPARDVREEISEMLRVITQATELARGVTGADAFAVWREVYERQEGWRCATNLPPLLAHFGTSLVERAMVEAVCRDAGVPFATALRSGLLGFKPGEIHASLAGSNPGDWLPAHPLDRVTARHTVGLADPLRERDIAGGERLADGLPQSLEAAIERYGLRHFKVKVTGRLAADRERTSAVAEVISQGTKGDFAFTLDGNEAFKTVAEFRDYWSELRADARLDSFFQRLLFVEQPLHRSVALAEDVGPALGEWAGAPPVIIDESDGELGSAARALALGYAGTSHKNCKGVFKGAANRCLIASRQRREPHRRFVMSGEDLCGVGPVAVVQDLAVQAALGNASIERNGHHYVAGLSPFPPAMQAAMLAEHGDLYGATPAGWPGVRIERGEIELGSVNAAPLGVAPVLDLSPLPRAFKLRPD